MNRIYSWLISLAPILCLRAYIEINAKSVFYEIGYLVANTKLYEIYSSSLYHPAIGAFLWPAYMAATISSMVIMTLTAIHRFCMARKADKMSINMCLREMVRYVFDMFVIILFCIFISLTAYQPEIS